MVASDHRIISVNIKLGLRSNNKRSGKNQKLRLVKIKDRYRNPIYLYYLLNECILTLKLYVRKLLLK